MISRASTRSLAAAAAPIALLWCVALMTACAGPSKPDVWPKVDALPQAPPAALTTSSAPAGALRRGEDGFMYLIGLPKEAPKAGQRFLARYSGQWPLKEVARPPLAAGQLLRVFPERGVALVQLSYAFPDVELDKLEVTWEELAPERKPEDVGKGLARVLNLKPDARSDVELSLGKNLGVQPGDLYGLFMASASGDPPQSQLQLGRRMTGLCLINAVDDERATCRLWRGGGLHPDLPEIKVGDEAIFLEHTFGSPPRQGVIQMARIKGDDGDKLRAHLIEQLNKYLTTHASPNITVEALDLEIDPDDPELHRVERLIESKDLPQLVMAGALRTLDGQLSLVVNYTGIGGATGPGMVAAPPERGVVMGPPGDLDGAAMRHLFGVLYSGMLVYRGQTSEALVHLRQLLAHEDMAGPLRWHARDQYAMRWAALGHVQEALWLVLEDEAVARQAKDIKAELNALGTRVRLYEMLETPAQAVAMARRYLELRLKQPQQDGVLSARSMLAEMILANQGPMQEVQAIIQDMERACPDGCQGDLFALLSAIYWSLHEGQDQERQALLTRMEELARREDASPQAMPTMWIYRGLDQLRLRDYNQALIAFLEAERLFKQRGSRAGLMRTQYFSFLCQVALKDPIKAYETATSLLELASEQRDWRAAKNVYDRMAGIYAELDPSQAPGAYLRIVSRILTSVFEAQQADGQLGRASETLFAIGNFFFRSGAAKEASAIFQRSVVYALRTARFDVAALGHLTLGLIARAQGDQARFEQELERARQMAKLAQDPQVEETIRRALEPSEAQEQDPVDTKLL